MAFMSLKTGGLINNNGAYIAQFQKMIIALYKIQNVYKEQEHA